MEKIIYKIENNNIIHKIKMKMYNKLLLRSVYYAVPWVLVVALVFIMYFNPVSYDIVGGLSFWEDYSNSIGCITLFVVIYYISGSYPTLLRNAFCEEIIDCKINADIFHKFENEFKRKGEIFIFLHKCSWIVAVLNPIFYLFMATQNGAEYWFNGISLGAKVYYCLFLLLTWYMSAKILVEAMFGCILSYELLKYDEIIKFDIDNRDGVLGNKKFVDLSIMNVAGGIYYFGVILGIIITDQLSHHFHSVDNAFYTIEWLGIVVLAICFYVIILFIIPLVDIQKSWGIKKSNILNKMDSERTKEEEEKIKGIEISITKLAYNKLPIIGAVVVPVTDIIIRLILSFSGI